MSDPFHVRCSQEVSLSGSWRQKSGETRRGRRIIASNEAVAWLAESTFILRVVLVKYMRVSVTSLFYGEKTLMRIHVKDSLSSQRDIHGPGRFMDEWRRRMFPFRVSDSGSLGCCELPWGADLL